MKKKIISIILALAILSSVFALSLTALASSQVLQLDKKATTNMNGTDDLEWFLFTPDQSGIYTFLSFNVPRSEAYLFTRELDPETGGKKLVQLAYNNSSPDYKERGQGNAAQICLTYHLEAGTTYYFGVGWWLPQTDSKFTVMLTCDSYDNTAIESITIDSTPTLTAYEDGYWNTDAKGKEYFSYDLALIISNTTITVRFTDGSVETVTGAQTIRDYNIRFLANQFDTHWYPSGDPEYTGNYLTIKILDKTAKTRIAVHLQTTNVKGKLVNRVGEPIANAAISMNSTIIGYTESDGSFSFYSGTGNRNVTFSTPSSINITKTLMLSERLTNDLTDKPIVMCNCDYVKDGVINAKDYAHIQKKLSGNALKTAEAEFEKSINYMK